MPGPLSPDVLARYADPASLSRSAPVTSAADDGPNWMHRLGLPVMAAGQGLDTGTTVAALRNPDLYESSALFGAHPSPARVIGTKAAVMVPLGLLLDHVYEQAPAGSLRRKVALAGALALGGFGTAIGAHNVQAMRR